MRLRRLAPGPLLALAAVVATAAGPGKDKENAGPADGAGDLLVPVRLEVNGKPIDTEIGHAAPFVGDPQAPRDRRAVTATSARGRGRAAHGVSGLVNTRLLRARLLARRATV